MGIAAAIISGVIAVGAAVAGGVSTSKAAEREEQLYEEEKRREEELFGKERKLKERQQNLAGLDYLATQRQQASMYDSKRQFNRDALTAFRNIRNASGVKPPPSMAQGVKPVASPVAGQSRAPTVSATPPQARGPAPTQMYTPPPAPQGMGNSTIGRRVV